MEQQALTWEEGRMVGLRQELLQLEALVVASLGPGQLV